MTGLDGCCLTNGMAEPTHIYVIGRKGGGPLKIGSALNPMVRLKALQTGSAETLALLHSVDVTGRCDLSARQAEARAHAALASLRMVGEWFDVDLTSAIAAIEDAINGVTPRREPGADAMRFVGVRMPGALVDRIDAYAKGHGLTWSGAIRALVEKGL